MEYKSQEVRFTEYQKAIDEILHEWPSKIINVFKSRSISPALSRDEIAELLKEGINNYEERGCNAYWFDEYKDYPTFTKDIGERVGRCFAHGIILTDALIKEFSVKRPDKIGRDLKVTEVKIVTGVFDRPVIQITYVASRLTFIVRLHTDWKQRHGVQNSILLLVEIEVRSTDPSLHFPSKTDRRFYFTIIDVEKDVAGISKTLETVINSQLE